MTSEQMTKQIEGVLAVHPEIAPSINRLMERLAAGDESAFSVLKELGHGDERNDGTGSLEQASDEERSGKQTDPSALPYEEWRKEFRSFLARQKPRNPTVDDSRESIYFGS